MYSTLAIFDDLHFVNGATTGSQIRREQALQAVLNEGLSFHSGLAISKTDTVLTTDPLDKMLHDVFETLFEAGCDAFQDTKSQLHTVSSPK